VEEGSVLSLPAAVCGTSDVSRYVVRGVLSRPDMRLAAVRVFSKTKEGRDAGELIGGPCGVLVTESTDALLASRIQAWQVRA